MPTIFRYRGYAIVVYPNDHPPAHVHVEGPDRRVVINLDDLSTRDRFGIPRPEMRRLIANVWMERDRLLERCRQIHE